MNAAKIFRDGDSRAIHLPENFRIGANEAYVTRIDSAVVLIPKENAWDVPFESIDGFSDDFMAARNQPTDPH